MIRFLAGRLGWLILTLWVVYTLSFLLMEAAPGGPLDAEQELAPEVKRLLEQRFLLDRSAWDRYWLRLAGCLHGDLGFSYRLQDYSVATIIGEGLPRSAALGGLALVIAVFGGIAVGAVAAAARGRALDTVLMVLVHMGLALPNFVLAGLAVLAVSFGLGWLPPAGWGGARELVLPSLCLGAPFAAAIARLARGGLLDVLNEDYIRTARAKGLSERVVVERHALRQALLPVMAFLGPTTAGVLSGSLVIERIFAIPGMGSHFVQAALSRDYTLAMGVVLLYTLLVSFLNLLSDLGLRWLDPRVRLW